MGRTVFEKICCENCKLLRAGVVFISVRDFILPSDIQESGKVIKILKSG